MIVESIDDRNKDMNPIEVMRLMRGNTPTRCAIGKKIKPSLEIKKKRNKKKSDEDNRKVQSFSRISVKADQCLPQKSSYLEIDEGMFMKIHIIGDRQITTLQNLLVFLTLSPELLLLHRQIRTDV